MGEIEFSVIEDSPEDTQVLSHLLKQFQAQYGVKVQLHVMEWEDAWQKLMAIALEGRGPDVSHVGSSWVSSLVMMNALRPFLSKEIARLGGPEAFIPPAWQSTSVPDDTRTWTIPWTSYFYVIAYRRDLLRAAGVNESAAFLSPKAIAHTVSRLQALGVKFPWLIPLSSTPSTDVLHIAANWVWGAGGEYIGATSGRPLFNEPQALSGLKAFFETYRCVPAAQRGIPEDEIYDIFARGDGAAILTDARAVLGFSAPEVNPLVRDNLRTCTPSKVPWYGGGNLVIWRHTRGSPFREQAAVELVSFLTSRSSQAQYAEGAGALPARADMLAKMAGGTHPLAVAIARIGQTGGLHLPPIPPSTPWLATAIARVSQAGRAYRPISLWRRFEFQLAEALNEILDKVRSDDQADIDNLLQQVLVPLEYRLSLLLS